jgi:peptide/nickel transport system substrate-binding protein
LGTFSKAQAGARGALLAALFLVGCPRAELPADTVVLLVESPPETLDRRLALSSIAENVSGNLLEPGLMRVDDDGQPVPDLAEKVEQLDATTYRFTLRPGLRFHDGAPLRAADVVATFESLRDPRLASPLAVKYRGFTLTADGDRVVRATLDQPYAPFLVDMGMGIVPARAQAAPGQDGFGRHPVGAGPFRFVSWLDDERLLLEANPDYYAGRPAIGHLLVKTVRDETTRVLELRSGKADIAINAISPPLLHELEGEPGLSILSAPGADTAYLMFQLDDPALRDVRVRRAVADAIDREALVRYKFFGHARLADSLLPPTNWAHSAGLRPVHHDPAAARALLDEAGLPTRGDGPRLSLTYKTSTDRFRKSLALAIGQQLAEAGLDVRVQTLEFGTFFSDIRKGNFQLASLKWVPIVEPDLLYWIFDSASIPTPDNDYNGADRGRYRNPALDALLTAARAEASLAARARDYAKAQEILADELPYIVLWHEDSVAVVRSDLAGFHLSPFGYFGGLAQAHRTAGSP